eukprot:6625943-Pyramimonas_sp.AAC.1
MTQDVSDALETRRGGPRATPRWPEHPQSTSPRSEGWPGNGCKMTSRRPEHVIPWRGELVVKDPADTAQRAG